MYKKDVSVLGIPGMHKILKRAKSPIPQHKFFLIRLGHDYGSYKIGDIISVENYRISYENNIESL